MVRYRQPPGQEIIAKSVMTAQYARDDNLSNGSMCTNERAQAREMAPISFLPLTGGIPHKRQVPRVGGGQKLSSTKPIKQSNLH